MASLNSFLIDGKTFSIEDIFTDDFIRVSDEKAHLFNSDLEVVNELFLHIYMPFLALDYFIKINKIESLKLTNGPLLLSCLVADLSLKSNIHLTSNSKFISFCHWKLKSFFTILISTLYLLFLMLRVRNFFRKNNSQAYDDLILITDKASEKKFENFHQKKIYGDFKNENSIYSYLSLSQRCAMVVKSFFTALISLNSISKDVKQKIGKNSIRIVHDIYGKRLVHTYLYSEALEFILHKFSVKNLFTGNNLDRFSIVEEKIAKKLKVKLICVPHGLEYGFKFPKGFTGDQFYATSQYASNYLNNLYSVNKFIFNESIVKACFYRNKNFNTSNRKVVFFTESREVNVNYIILASISQVFKDENIPFFVKLHPNDNSNNYLGLNLFYIEDLDCAISNNICIARKSTILLEAIYNNSESIAILINEKDSSFFNKFPSLQIKNIYRTTNTNDLIKLTLKLYLNKIKYNASI